MIRPNKWFVSVMVLLLLLTGCTAQKTGQEELTGVVEAKEVDVNTKVPGRIVKLYVQEGQQVKAGDLLAKIDDEDLKAKEAQALAGIAAANGDIAKAAAGSKLSADSTAAAVQKAEAALAKAKADAELARKTYERMVELHKAQAISDQQMDSAEKDYKAALAGVAAAEGDLANARASRLQVDVYQADMQRAEAALAKAEADLQQVRINLKETNIKAPCSGTITSLNVEEGEMVSTGLPLMTVTDYADNWVNVKVKQSVLDKIKEGQQATLIPVSVPDKKYTGKIVDISRKPEFATARATNDRGEKDIVTYNVKIKVNSAQLRPGMSVQVKFE
ncbi:HlyD family secretion protein [Desulforamulus putei DSM 12395]|uniref:HlyD family secretion protein n=1 Tax=Desulforamulus putei DSM 12395 TaxID=1121429 RepID=A0A1M4V9G0_9FIRM|nr:efflux RND transporter periplasmic adaptor subunit [Desulforamulus putei]SHE65575.1 HlyD family secretion protein [Desulforamulus putei DSM 12395]